MKQKTSKQRIYDLILAALCMALGIVLPFFTGQIPQIGGMLLPMHLPVLLCGLLCGWQYGGLVGFVLPLLRYAMFGMPPIFPTGIAMAFELAAYGIIAGYLYNHSRWQCVISLYRSLIAAMIGGRIVWGVVRVLLTGVYLAAVPVRRIPDRHPRHHPPACFHPRTHGRPRPHGHGAFPSGR